MAADSGESVDPQGVPSKQDTSSAADGSGKENEPVCPVDVEESKPVEVDQPIQERDAILAESMARRVERLTTKILQHCKDVTSGDRLFQKLLARPNHEVAGVPYSRAEVDEVRKKCERAWAEKASSSGAIEKLVRRALEACDSMTEVDQFFRRLQPRIGQEYHGFVLTDRDLRSGRMRCQDFWARVTPGNVEYIMRNVLSVCKTTEEADKKFRWLKNKGSWDEDRRNVEVNGRRFAAEDLDVAEKRCKQKLKDEPSSPLKTNPSISQKEETHPNGSAVSIVRGGKGRQSSMDSESSLLNLAAVPSKPTAPLPAKSAAKSTMSEEKPLLSLVPGQATKPVTKAAKKPEKTEKSDIDNKSNVEFLVESITSKCDSQQAAGKFFQWLRMNLGSSVKGRTFTAEDLDTAEHRCSEVWKKKKQDMAPTPKESMLDQEAAPKPNSKISNVDLIVRHILQKSSGPAMTAKFIAMLRTKVGQVNPMGRIFSAEDIQQAEARCKSLFGEQNAVSADGDDEQGEDSDGEDSEKASSSSKSDEESDSDDEKESAEKMSESSSSEDSDEEMTAEQKEQEEQAKELEAELRKMEKKERKAEKKAKKIIDRQNRERREKEEAKEQARLEKEMRKMEAKKERKEKKKERERKQRLKKLYALKGKSMADEDRDVAADDAMAYALFGGDSSSEDEMSGDEEGYEIDAEDDSASKAFEDDLEELDDVAIDDGYKGDWTGSPEQGSDGFNAFAADVLKKAGIGGTLDVVYDEEAACPSLQPHQEAVAFLLHPKSPVKHLLVDHPTGSGKTREMIRSLDNFFFDKRPKIPIFPRDAVCRNFYFELLRWPSKYRDYFSCMNAYDAKIASGVADWKSRRQNLWDLSSLPELEVRRLCDNLRTCLEMKGTFFSGRVRASVRASFRKKHPGESYPSAPLRALKYTSAGGSNIVLKEDGRPLSALFKIGFNRLSGNVYDNKIVLMDEVHNLVRTQTQYAEQLERLRDRLVKAKNLILAGFTGTPILNEPEEGRRLLDVIKGEEAPACDEGFLSSFPMRPVPLFPRVLPLGVPDAVLTQRRQKALVRKVILHGEILKIYDHKNRDGIPARRLRAYCNISAHFGSFHDGKHGTKAKILAAPEDHCPKLLAIAHDVAAGSTKALIMISKSHGYLPMLSLMKQIAESHTPPFGVATLEELSQFNNPKSNLRGETYRVMVADATQCSEGISFLQVRRCFLADIPSSPSTFIQQCGRAIRMHGHRGLPTEEQDVTYTMYLSQMPKWLRSPLAAWCLRAQKKFNEGREMEVRAKQFLRRMKSVGIKDLNELKKNIDALGAQKERPEFYPEDAKVPLDTEDVVELLEQLGLWEDAKLLWQAERQAQLLAEKERLEEEKLQAEVLKGPPGSLMIPKAKPIQSQGSMASVASSVGRTESQDLEDSIMDAAEDDLEGESQPANKAPEPDTGSSQSQVLQAGDSGMILQDNIFDLEQELDKELINTGVAPVHKTTDEDEKKKAKMRPRALVRAVQALHLAESAAAFTETLSFETADEEGMKQLARLTEDFVPALSGMRRIAVDRSCLKTLPGRGEGSFDAESEDEVDEEVSESEGDESQSDAEGKKSKVAPLVLPEGWKVERKRGEGSFLLQRTFLDPSGTQYKSLAAVRRAIFLAEAKKEGEEAMSLLKGAFVPGQRIVLRGLQARQDLNGTGGTITSWMGTKGRWEVQVDGVALPMNVRPENIMEPPTGWNSPKRPMLRRLAAKTAMQKLAAVRAAKTNEGDEERDVIKDDLFENLDKDHQSKAAMKRPGPRTVVTPIQAKKTRLSMPVSKASTIETAPASAEISTSNGANSSSSKGSTNASSSGVSNEAVQRSSSKKADASKKVDDFGEVQGEGVSSEIADIAESAWCAVSPSPAEKRPVPLDHTQPTQEVKRRLRGKQNVKPTNQGMVWRPAASGDVSD